jgi:hypothetical protein
MGLKPVTTMSTTRLHPAWEKVTELFGVDVRSLAAFRIGVALVLLTDLWFRGREITAYFTDAGVLPRSVLIALYADSDPFGFRHAWSLHMLSGTYWSQLVLFVIAAWFAMWLLIGYRTKLAAIASWILLVSLDARNPVILNSGDVLLRSMLLWSLFLPLGAAFSVDRRGSSTDESTPCRILSAASIALLLQLCMMYLISAGFKAKSVEGFGSPWTDDLSAVYYALHCDAYATRFGVWLRQFPTLMQFLTGSSWWLECVGPIIIFSPLFTKWIRIVAVGVFAMLHFAMGMSLTVGLFPAICIICWLVFLPTEFWEWFRPGPSKFPLTRITRRLDELRLRLFTRPETPAYKRRLFVEVPLLLLFSYVVIWNVRELDFEAREWLMSRRWNAPARALGLDQNWSMFAPVPRTEDGWLVMKGTLHDGSEVNLWQFDEPLPWDKPELVSSTYLTQRWRKYLDNVTTNDYAEHTLYFCDWLAQRWNRERAGDDPERRVYQVQFIRQLEITPPPGEPIPEAETEVLYTLHPLDG